MTHFFNGISPRRTASTPVSEVWVKAAFYISRLFDDQWTICSVVMRTLPTTKARLMSTVGLDEEIAIAKLALQTYTVTSIDILDIGKSLGLRLIRTLSGAIYVVARFGWLALYSFLATIRALVSLCFLPIFLWMRSAVLHIAVPVTKRMGVVVFNIFPAILAFIHGIIFLSGYRSRLGIL